MSATLRILMVDDSPAQLSLLRGHLETKGFKDLQEAENGDIALKRMQEFHEKNTPFELVLCDWNMPGKSGLELIRELRADMRFRTVPVIMITTANQFNEIKTAIASGATNYLVKPYTEASLMEKVDFVIEKYRLGKS